MPTHRGTRFGEAQPDLNEAELDQQNEIHVFLLSGQSNMKGRAPIDLKPTINPNIIFFHSTECKWYIARDPIHALGTPDLIDGNDNAGTGPGISFANHLIKNSSIKTIALIPTAVGGAPIDSFSKEGNCYLRSLELCKKGLEALGPKASLKGILWLQGESDSSEERYVSYEQKLHNLVDRYRKDLNSNMLPLIACTIGSFIYKENFKHSKKVNEVLMNLPNHKKNTLCIDALDLDGHIGDFLHYDENAQFEIGKRYANAYLDNFN